MGRRFLLIALVLWSAAAGASTVAAESTGDAGTGQDIFDRQCKTCHQIGAEARHRVGPHLNGIFGRKAGSSVDYTYSKAMILAGTEGLIWDHETLAAYVESPKALVTGTKMSFRGIKSPVERADLVAFLRSLSDNPADLPESLPTLAPDLPALSPEVLAIKGDLAYGEYLSSDCRTCHQADGSDQGIPAINGWPEEDFVRAMHAYKLKLRPHPVMQMMAVRLSDEEIAALAAYFATLD